MTLPILLSYIDPLSGSVLLQLVLAGLVGSVAFFRRSIAGVLRAILRLK